MSRQSLRQYEEHLRSTLPPPPPESPVAELERQERKYAHRASRALEKARECRAMIDLLRGTPRNDAEFDRRVDEINRELEHANELR